MDKAIYSASPVRDRITGGDSIDEAAIHEQISEVIEPEEQPPVVEDSPEEEVIEEEVIEEAPTQDEAEEIPIDSVHQLAEALEVKGEDLENLQYTFKENGEDVTVQLGELRSGYQRQADYTRKQQELAQQRKDLESQNLQRQEKLQRETVQLGQVLSQTKQLMAGDMNNAEMQQLRLTNPAEYTARAIDYQNRVSQLDQLYNLASQQYQQYVDDGDATAQKEFESRKSEELDKLRTALPEWGENLRNDIVGYLTSNVGFTNDDVGSVMDHRLLVLANKARLYDESQKVSKQVKKTVKALPKVVSGKKPKPKTTVQQMNMAKAKKRLAQSGNRRDAADAIGYLNLD